MKVNKTLYALGLEGNVFDPPETWEGLRAAVRAGKAGLYLDPGDVLNVGINGANWDFDVLGIDEDEPVDAAREHCLSIQMHKVFAQLYFDPSQYLFAVTAASLTALGISGTTLPAGTYNVTLDHGAYNGGTSEDGTFEITTTVDIPIGGGIRHSYMGTYQSSSGDYAKAKVLAGTWTTYGADTITVLEQNLTTTDGNSGISLGTTTASTPSYKVGDYINFTQRQRYGSNRWKTSWIRQYLNSDEATFVWVPKTIWSRNITGTFEGFLHTLDPELRAVLGKVRTRYALSVADGSGYEDIEDFCKLMTYTDLTANKNNNVIEGPVDSAGNVTRTGRYSFWQTRTTNADRIKYQGTTAHNWWLASAYPSHGNYVWVVLTSGSVSYGYGYAIYSYGVVPSLFII